MGEQRYRAFISYSHADERWATWLQRRLEAFQEKQPGKPRHPLRPVFRDRSELAAGELSPAIEAALAASDALIVICSPASAASEWVAAEIRSFKSLHSDPLILPLVVEGSSSEAYQDAFPEELTFRGDDPSQPLELLAADAREDRDGKKDAALKLIAALLGQSFDSLKRRADAARFKRLITVAAGAVIVAAGAVVLSIVTLLARQEAEERREQAEELVTFMIGDVRDELGDIGRLDLMEAVGNEALAYFESLDMSELTPEVLLQRGRALRQIGDVRVDRGELDDGLALYLMSLETLRAGAAPLSQGTLAEENTYEQALTHLEVATVHYMRAETEASREAMIRNRDLVAILLANDKDNLTYLTDLAVAENNLGAISFADGDYAAAESHFRAALQRSETIMELNPDDLNMGGQIAGIEIWLGNLADNKGDPASARAHYESALEKQRSLTSFDPSPANREALARYLTIASVANRETDPYQAIEQAREAASQLRELAAFEPDNAVWQQRLNRGITILVGSLLEVDCDADALTLLDEVRESSTRLLADDEKNLESQRDLIDADVLGARYAIGTASFVDAENLASTAVERAQHTLAQNPDDDLSKRYLLRAIDPLVRARWLQGRESDARVAAALSLALAKPIEDPAAETLRASLENAARGDWSGWPPEPGTGGTRCGS